MADSDGVNFIQNFPSGIRMLDGFSSFFRNETTFETFCLLCSIPEKSAHPHSLIRVYSIGNLSVGSKIDY